MLDDLMRAEERSTQMANDDTTNVPPQIDLSRRDMLKGATCGSGSGWYIRR